MNSLDQSHRTLLENFATFRQAERCLADTEAYVKGVLQEVLDELSFRYRGVAIVSFKEGCLQLDAFPNWRSSGCHFVSIGLENIKVANLFVGTGDEPCRAYIWSAYLLKLEGHKPPDEAWLRTRQLPMSFKISQQGGYLATKQLAPLSVDQMMNRGEVLRNLREPLETLASWLDENTDAIRAFAQQDQPSAL